MRDIPVGNGNLLVAFDKHYILREFHFPHVGEENHTAGEAFRFGVWADGRFSWVGPDWRISMDYQDASLVTEVRLENKDLGVRILANDLVDFHENIYLKKLTVENLAPAARELRLFLCHDFHIYGNSVGDTAAYRPEAAALLHYKGERYFLINLSANGKNGVEYFATGKKEQGGAVGTWKDAEDGELGGNPIAQGSVDSCVGVHLRLGPGESAVCYYWVCAGRNWEEVSRLNSVVLSKTPEVLLKRTADYWKLWGGKERLNKALLPENIARLYGRSLLIARTQINNTGSIIAANDSDYLRFNHDTYSYMWTRDASLASYALDLAGYPEITQSYFNLCANIITKDGYFMHKYNPSGTLASSWEPWVKDNIAQLPIQEDETALVVWALWEHYKLYKDIEFIKPLYRRVIKSAADFMLNYLDARTGLPLPSYDLWEERRGVLTFTVATVHAGLTAAANFTEAFGETGLTLKYREGAGRIRAGMDKHLYLEKERRFARMVNFREDGTAETDAAVDASLLGAALFGAYGPDDERIKSTVRQIEERLWNRTTVGGLARFEDDAYYRAGADVPGNPWFVTTLWLAQYYIAAARDKEGLAKALSLLDWVARRALPSGVLAEQVDPHTDEPLSVSPLTWSHAAFITAVQEYLNKLLSLEKCAACGMPRYPKYL